MRLMRLAVGDARAERRAAMGREEAHLVALCRPATPRGAVRYPAPGAP